MSSASSTNKIANIIWYRLVAECLNDPVPKTIIFCTFLSLSDTSSSRLKTFIARLKKDDSWTSFFARSSFRVVSFTSDSKDAGFSSSSWSSSSPKRNVVFAFWMFLRWVLPRAERLDETTCQTSPPPFSSSLAVSLLSPFGMTRALLFAATNHRFFRCCDALCNDTTRHLLWSVE